MAEALHNFNNIDDIEFFIYNLKSSPQFQAIFDKTQVFNERATNNVKTRGSHSNDVGDTAQTLVTELTGDSLESRKAYLMGLLHDIGHIPYGHAGESSASHIVETSEYTEEEKKEYLEIRSKVLGSEYADQNQKMWFEHNENSAFVFVMLCKEFKFEVDQEIITGILAHSTSRYKDIPPTNAQQAVRLADKIAYINYDIDDLYQTFTPGTPEFAALEELYGANDPSKLVQDPKTHEPLKITLPDGREITSYDFIKLDSAERIKLFVNEAVKLAKGNNNKITGCNDIAVEIAGLQKDKRKTTDKAKLAELDNKINAKWDELYEKSPIYFMAYRVKDKSDEFIRSANGLSSELQDERTRSGRSAVGNEDLLNEFCYKVIAAFMNKTLINWKNNPEAKEADLKSFPPAFKRFMAGFDTYLEKEKESIKNAAGLKADGTEYALPLTVTIVNYIGTCTNSELDELKEELHIEERFKEEVLPHLEELLTSEYRNEDHTLNQAGSDKRKSIIQEYGAPLVLDFSLEEEGLSPLTTDAVIARMEEEGYIVGRDDESAPKKSSTEKLQGFMMLASQKEREAVNAIIQEIMANERTMQAENSENQGVKL